jgi:hypothetical protein
LADAAVITRIPYYGTLLTPVETAGSRRSGVGNRSHSSQILSDSRLLGKGQTPGQLTTDYAAGKLTGS